MDTTDISEVRVPRLVGKLPVKSGNPGTGRIDQIFAPDHMVLSCAFVM
jgi:hypothetical protein